MNLGVVVNVLGGEGTRPVPASNGAAVFVVVSSLLGLPEWVCNTTFCCQADLRVSTEQPTLLHACDSITLPYGHIVHGNSRASTIDARRLAAAIPTEWRLRLAPRLSSAASFCRIDASR